MARDEERRWGRSSTGDSTLVSNLTSNDWGLWAPFLVKRCEENMPTNDAHALKTAHAWRSRALPNMMGYLKGKDEDIEKYDQGELGYMRGTAHNIMMLECNLDNVGDKWWEYVPEEIVFKYGKNMTQAEKMASNIWRTVGDYWKTPESILKENITGPIDEQELLKYLKPGETV